ncbi:ATP-binding protein [Caballeronia ptereochthonis]|uniref:Virulence sensor protein BvgS n=1 Tax=Caballeronia ptereochthonis TaxID=1777144 RepID=A0A158ADH9_9BURK|nr:transporter substrate-binding domain-containing protein [Caballeronia ptereochthonis]SAK55810.1 two component regulatory system sensor kinase [Caballeronia ptereochthonis]
MNNVKRDAGFIWRYIAAFAIIASAPLICTGVSARENNASTESNPGVITVGIVRGGWSPFVDDASGTPGGLGGDYLKQALKQIPFTINIFDSQDALNNAACRGDVDLVLDGSHTASKQNCFIYSDPYYKSATVAVTRTDRSRILPAGRFQSLSIAMEKGTFLERLMRQVYPRALFVLTQTPQEALDAIRAGKADVHIGPRAVIERMMRQNSRFDSLAIHDSQAGPAFELRFAIARSKPELLALVNSGIKAISQEAHTQILSRWISTSYDANAPDETLGLTDAERRFLRSLPTIRTSLIVRFSPFSYLDESGRLTGILPEYLGYLSERLGLRFEQRAEQSPGAEGQALKAGTTDLIVYVLPLDAKVALPGVTHAVEIFPVIIAGKRDAAPLNDISQIGRARVAVVERSQNLEMLRERAPHAVPVMAASLGRALTLVREGKADVAIGNLAVIDYLLQRGFGDDIKVLGTTGYQQAIGFQLSPGLEPLIPILNRTIASMPESQRTAIRNRHLSTSYQLGLRWGDVWTRAAPFVLAIALGAVVLIVSHGRLRKEVRRRKLSEQALQTQLRFRETLLDMVPIPIAIRDKRGAYLDVNAAGIDAMNIAKDEVIGRTLDECVAAAPVARSLPEIVHGFMRYDQRYDGVHIDYVDANGVQKHGLYWHRPFQDERGNIEGTVGAIVDLTELLTAQEQMRVAQALLTDVTDNLPAAVFQMKRAPDGQLSFPYIGGDRSLFPSIRLGASIVSALDAQWSLLPDDIARLESALDATSTTLDPISLDFRVGRYSSNRWLHVNAVPRREGDGGTLWSGYWSDTTIEHARSLELEKARDEAQRLSSAKDQFLAVMSHEIRTPMSGVLGLVEVLEKSRLGPEQTVMVCMIRESGSALLKLLDNILDFSKIEAAKLVLEQAVFDLREECDLVMGICSGRAHAKGLTLRCRVGRDVAALLIGDSLRLRQVLFNLLSNAIKFTANGTVSLSVDVERGDDRLQALRIQVRDTGIGIDADAIKKLFAPFAQAQSSTSRQFGGSGLGLLISRKLAELMGGSLVMQSEPGRGTTVSVRIALPVSEQRAAPAMEGKAQALVLVQDPCVAGDLLDRLAALGIDAHAPEPDCPSAELQAKLARARLIFVDEPIRHLAGARGEDAISITEHPELAGYSVSESGLLLSVNPLYMRALKAVCERVDRGSEMAAAHEESPLVSTQKRLTRDDALQSGSLILVAEDNPVNRHLIQSQLRLLGCVCDVVDDGAQALIAYDACAYAILLTDCQMPRMDGYELAAHIRTRERSENLAPMPIVGVTASIEPGEIGHCIDAGMNDCIHKPASLESLRVTLEKWAPICLSRTEPAAAGGAPKSSVESAGARAGEDSVLTPLLDGVDEQLLEVLVQSLREDAASLSALLQEPDSDRLKQWLHRTTGAVAALHYAPLLEALSEFRTFVVQGGHAEIRKAGQLLLDKLDRITARLSATEA